MPQSTAVGTWHASHAHHTPHTGRPHNEPSTRVSAVKITPSSADAPAMRSHTVARVRGHNQSAEPSAVTPNARYAIHAAGTCRYIRRCASPCTSSFGAPHKPNSASTTTDASASQPSSLLTCGFSSLVLSFRLVSSAASFTLVPCSCFLQERAEGQHPDRREEQREHREERHP